MDRPRVSLHTAENAACAHEAVFIPWLKNAAADAWREREPMAVLVPFRSDAYYLKSLALERGIALLGLHFITPGELRERLTLHFEITGRVPLREHMHLLLATAAERCGEAGSSVAASPDRLLKAIDLVSAGGWDFPNVGPAELQPIVAEFEKLMRAAKFQTMHAADRALLDRATKCPAHFGALFITGFDAAHWPLWPLLAAAAHSAKNATVCLIDPRAEAAALEATWIGTWEEMFGAAQPVPADDLPRPLVEILHLPDTNEKAAQRMKTPAREVEFIVAQDTTEHARAIVAKILQCLADQACKRLGVVFPNAGALSRRVADLLARRQIPHNDGIAHQAPGPLENAAWPAWLALQETPRIPALLHFLREHHAPQKIFANIPLSQIERMLAETFGELLLDDLSIVAEFLAQHSRKPDAAAIARGIRATKFLPERATIAAFIEATDFIFRELEWNDRADELARLAGDWNASPTLKISRRAWLRWLRETLVSWKAVRAELGNHAYSRVHLLPNTQAESQSWTHVIVAGLGESRWPAAFDDAGFLGENEIDALNRRVRMLNERATTQGSQGEGHETIEPGKTLCLGPAQRRDLALRQFLNTLESATIAVTASAQIFEEATPDRHLNPGDFFTRLYFCARGRAVSQGSMNELRAETKRWLDASGLWKSSAHDIATVRQTRIAFDARRDSAKPFGEYEFALRSPLSKPLRLSATDWEKCFKTPALIWMRHLLGVEAPRESDETPWNLATGLWVHAWLRTISNSNAPNFFAPLPAPDQIAYLVTKSANEFRERVHAILQTSGRAVPEWWQSTWQQAHQIASQLAVHIASTQGRSHVATEWKFDDTAIPLGEASALHVRGRVDLILATSPACENAWIVDFKTGNRKALSTKKLATGEGVQLALYALALHARGAREVGTSVLAPQLDLSSPQLVLADIAAQSALWRALCAMQESGVFGMRGALRSEFAFNADYPLTTLAIDEDVLDAKWALTHPDFSALSE